MENQPVVQAYNEDTTHGSEEKRQGRQVLTLRAAGLTSRRLPSDLSVLDAYDLRKLYGPQPPYR